VTKGPQIGPHLCFYHLPHCAWGTLPLVPEPVGDTPHASHSRHERVGGEPCRKLVGGASGTVQGLTVFLSLILGICVSVIVSF
jgi:hypothetical protein